MKILLAPSETKTLFNNTTFEHSSLFLHKALGALRAELIDEYNYLLGCGNLAMIQTMFGLKKEKEIEQYEQIIDQTSPACSAIKLYSGVAFDHLDFSSLTLEAREYIKENVILFSNLFGAVLAKDHLPLYRLQQGKNIGKHKTEELYKATLKAPLDTY